MNYRRILGDVCVAFSAQGVSLVISLLTGLLIPKALGVEQYGYFQLFVFYSTYVGFFHFGLNDGIYLIHGGTTRRQIDKRSLNSQFTAGMSLQLVFSMIITGVSLVAVSDSSRAFVLFATGIYLLIYNAAGFLGFVFQTMNETRLFSLSVMVDRIALLFPLAVLLLLRCEDFEWYVSALLMSKTVALGVCVFFGQDILRAGRLPFRATLIACVSSMRVGIKLMTANIAGLLVLGVVRFVIDAVWGIQSFGEFSLALSMVGFFMAFISQASMVLFPSLRQGSVPELQGFFRSTRDILAILSPFAYFLFFPGAWFLNTWLPDYVGSVSLLALLLPVCVFDGQMNLIGSTFLKVLRREGALLRINLTTVALSTFSSLLGGFVFRSMDVIVIGVVVAIAGRAVFSEYLVSRSIGVETSSLKVFEVLLMVVFVAAVRVMPAGIAAGIMATVYGAFLFAYRRRLSTVFSLVKGLRKGFK